MPSFYKPFADRTPDHQYHRRLMQILDEGELAGKTEQGPGAYTCFGTLPQMVFDLSNGVPLITERSLPSWRSAVAEILAFINGARTIDEIESFGVNKALKEYQRKRLGLHFPFLYFAWRGF